MTTHLRISDDLANVVVRTLHERAERYRRLQHHPDLVGDRHRRARMRHKARALEAESALAVMNSGGYIGRASAIAEEEAIQREVAERELRAS